MISARLEDISLPTTDKSIGLPLEINPVQVVKEETEVQNANVD